MNKFGYGLGAALSGLTAYHVCVRDLRTHQLYGSLVEQGVSLLRTLDAEQAHGYGIAAAAMGLTPKDEGVNSPERARALSSTVCGLTFRNPVGLAAGFDKQGEAMGPLLDAGFGFVEVGTVTPLPQPGNPTPRMFRLPLDAAVINRFGFNSDGLEVVAGRLANYWGPLSRAGTTPGSGGNITAAGTTTTTTTATTAATATASPPPASAAAPRGLLGVNIGKNKEGEVLADYCAGIAGLAPFGDYVTINISSPNTPGLRALQGREQLRSLLLAVKAARDALPWGVPLPPPPQEVESTLGAVNAPHVWLARQLVAARPTPPPLWVKIAPDLTEADLVDIAAVVLETGMEGVIVSNTTVARPSSLVTAAAANTATGGGGTGEAGGLSGQPLFLPSTRVLARMHVLLGGKVALIGVGGVSNAQQAYEKIKAGASLVQIYTALAYSSPALIPKINAELQQLLTADGHTNITQAVGKEAKGKWGGGAPFQ